MHRSEPRIDPTVFLASGAQVVGDVEIAERSSIWFNAVVRGDTAHVRIGARTNVQDGAVVHTDTGHPCVIGDDCTIGHLAILHGCAIGNSCLIGMGAIVLTGAAIGEQSIVAAGSLVPGGKSFPARSLLVGSPVSRVRDVTDEEVERLIEGGAQTYLRLAAQYGGAESGESYPHRVTSPNERSP